MTAVRPVHSRHIIAEQIEVGVPANAAFDTWTQYDKWQGFFKKESASANGKSSRGESSGDVKVTSKIGPSQRQWEAEITNLDEGRRIDWQSKGGVKAKGATTFHSLQDRLTRIAVEVEYQPSGLVETIGNFFRMPRRRVRKDLRLFKNYIELHDGGKA